MSSCISFYYNLIYYTIYTYIHSIQNYQLFSQITYCLCLNKIEHRLQQVNLMRMKREWGEWGTRCVKRKGRGR